MKGRLNPVLVRTLRAFGRRRRRLVLLRGLGATAAAAVAATALGAAVDYYFVLPEVARVALSAFVYAAVLLVLYRTCLRFLKWRMGLRELARSYENYRPELREEILAAVELGLDESGSQVDSAALRARLQDQAAARVKGHDVMGLLPGRLVRRWVSAGGAAVALCGVLCLAPGLEYPRLLARVLAPLAPIDRVSRTKIRLLEPGRTDTAVPRGDPLKIVVETRGLQPDDALVEFSEAGNKWNHLRMDPVGGADRSTRRRFEATLTINGDYISFRVRAGDGSTPLLTLRAAPRPAVVVFNKNYHYPVYSRLADRTVAEATGDLAAIEGTSVTLGIVVDQPIARGMLEVAGADNSATTTIALHQDNGPTTNGGAPTTTTLTGIVRMKASGSYRVRLVAERTGFENRFSPQYEIKVQSDGPPAVVIHEPLGALGLGAAGQVLFAGEARDDVALGRVSEKLSVNGGPWRETPLFNFGDNPRAGLGTVPGIGTEYPILKRVRMGPLGLKAGDCVLVKYAATDGKGQTAESAVTTITIAAGATAADRLRAATERRLLQGALDQLRAAGKELGAQAKPMQQAFGNKEERRAAIGQSRALAEKTARAAEGAWLAMQEALRGSASPREAEDLAALGRQLSQLRNDALDRARGALDAAAANADNAKKEDIDRAAGAMNNAAWQAERIARTHQELFAAEQVEGMADELALLAREQTRLARQAESAQDAPAWNDTARRQEQLNAELAAAEDAMERVAADLDEWQGRDVRAQKEKLKNEREATAQALAAKGPGAALAEDVQRMDRSLADATSRMNELRDVLAARAERNREELARSLPRSADAIAAIARDPKRPANGISWRGAIASLEDRAALEEARTDADYQFAADTARAAEAVRALSESSPGPIPDRETQEKLAGVERAYRTLETARDMDETAGRLNAQAQQERMGATPVQTAQTAGQWRVTEAELNNHRNQVSRLGMPKEVAKEMEQVAKGPAAEAVRREVRERERDREGTRPAQNMAASLDAVRAGLDSVAAKVKEKVETERQALIAAAPTIEQLAAQAAQEANVLKRENAEKADISRPDAGAEGARESLRKQQTMNPRLGRLRDALRRDANEQDLAGEEGRERARDADDALAMLREPPPRAEAALEQAAAAPANDAAKRREALAQAARHEDNLARSLDAIAMHYRNLEAGRAEETREMLRQAEAADAQALDAQYAEAGRLAELAAASPEALRAALEAELPRNAAMREELDAIKDNTAKQAAATLDEAARKEGEIARRLDELAKAPPRRPPSLKPQTQSQQHLNKDVEAAATDLERAALHARRLNHPEAAALGEAGEAAKAITKQELPKARQGLEQAEREKKPAPAQAPVERARAALERTAEKLADAAQQAGGQQANAQSAQPSAAARWMAQTLDRLDAAALSQQAAASSQQPPAQNAQASQAAQASAQAAQAGAARRGAQQLMAQARAERLASPADDTLSMTSGPPPGAGSGKPLPTLGEMATGEWGKLREQSASDPAQAAQESVAEDYRAMVNAYYKALARRGK